MTLLGKRRRHANHRDNNDIYVTFHMKQQSQDSTDEEVLFNRGFHGKDKSIFDANHVFPTPSNCGSPIHTHLQFYKITVMIPSYGQQRNDYQTNLIRFCLNPDFVVAHFKLGGEAARSFLFFSVQCFLCRLQSVTDVLYCDVGSRISSTL